MQKKGPAACVLALALSFGAAEAATPEACSSDTFPMDGAQIAVQTCAAGPSAKAPATPKPGSASIVQTFSSHGASFSQTTSVEYLAGSEISRTIADVSLAPLGIAKTLHMTIAYKPGSAKVERALLVPGAIVLK